MECNHILVVQHLQSMRKALKLGDSVMPQELNPNNETLPMLLYLLAANFASFIIYLIRTIHHKQQETMSIPSFDADKGVGER